MDPPDLNIDRHRCRVYVRGKEIPLSYTEYLVLAELVSQAGHPLSAEELLRKIWNSIHFSRDIVKWHVANLRRKLEDDPANPKLIVTRRGFGYSYEGLYGLQTEPAPARFAGGPGRGESWAARRRGSRGG